MPSSRDHFEISRAISISIHAYSRQRCSGRSPKGAAAARAAPHARQRRGQTPPSPWQATGAEPISTTLGVRRP